MYRGASPDSNDYNTRMDFPPHQLMQSAQNNFSPQSSHRGPAQPTVPQVFASIISIITILLSNALICVE